MEQGQDDLGISTPPASPLRQAESTPQSHQLGGLSGSATPGNVARPMLGMLSQLSASWDGGMPSNRSSLSRDGSSVSSNTHAESNLVFANVGQENSSPMHGMLTTPRQTIQRPLDGPSSHCDGQSESVGSASSPFLVGNPSIVVGGASAAATAILPPPLPLPPGLAYSMTKDENGHVQGQVQGPDAEETSKALPSNQPQPVQFGMKTRELSMVDEQTEKRFANPAPIPNPTLRLDTS